MLVPGKQAGPISTGTSRADLAALFGEKGVVDVEIDVGEGMFESGTRVMPQGDGQVEIIWTDMRRVRPRTARSRDSTWKTAEGIGIGSTLSDLQVAAGEFQVLGFGWDYGGTVDLTGSRLDAWQGGLLLRMRPSDPNNPKLDVVSGDTPYPSGSPDVAALDLRVSEWILTLEAGTL